MAVRFGVLGTVAVWRDAAPVDIGHARQRWVLGALLADPGEAVPADVLVDRVWGECAPGRDALYGYVSRLRRALSGVGADIVRERGGYRLRAPVGSVDVHRFRDLANRARTAAGEKQASRLWEEALGLWRGPAFAGADTPWFNAERDLLDRERLAARLDLADIRLRLGQHEHLVADLVALARAHPLNERVAGQLMLAFHQGGRSADALACYQEIRRHLTEELGSSPGPALRRLHERILAADPALDAAPARFAATPPAGPSRPVPRQLPAPPTAFIGRRHELAFLDEMLKEPDGDGPASVISAIGGTGGIGKTWLALRWAHEHLARFPDGQLYAQLSGFDPTGPTPPATVLRGFLEALGTEPGSIPADPEAQAGLFRSLTADRRMLVVLDNARDADQVRPLLPGGAPCTVLVTSRNDLGGLTATHGCRYTALDTLHEEDARGILLRALGHDRMAAEPAALAAVLRQCAGLPLALSVVAARAAARPGLPLAALAAELDDATTRLDALSAGDLATDLRAVFDTSYRALDARSAQVFALLGLAPGPDIGLDAAAALTALPAHRARAVLRTLETAHLLQQHALGRYRMHDLVRLYAAERGNERPTDVRDDALRRVVGFYAGTALACDRLLAPHRTPIAADASNPGTAAGVLRNAGSAMSWFEAEHPCLLAVHAFALTHGQHDRAWRLAWALDTFHWRRGRLPDRVQTLEATLPALEGLEEPAGPAPAHRLLARALVVLGRHDRALEHLGRALALYEKAGDAAGQAQTHLNLAVAWERRGDDARALAHTVRNLRIRRTLHDPPREAEALNAVGWYHARLGHHRQARHYCGLALALCRRHGFVETEAFTLDSLGYTAHHSGRHALAVEYYGQALVLCHRLGDHYEEADTLACLGRAHHALGRIAEARHAWGQALALYLDQHRAAEVQRIRQHLATLDEEPG